MTHLFGIRINGMEGDNVRFHRLADKIGWLLLNGIMFVLCIVEVVDQTLERIGL